MSFFNTTQTKKITSIWQYSDKDLVIAFGDDWHVAREMIDKHNEDVARGYLKDWENIMEDCVGQEATINQQMMLKRNGYPITYDKRDASAVIDLIVFKCDLKREILWRKDREEREALRAQREADRLAKKLEQDRARKEANAEKEHDMMVKNSANINRIRKSFEKLWNELLVDDKFTEVEIYRIKHWCEFHKHLNDDFHVMIALCDKVVEDHVVDPEENGLLYDEALHMVERMIPAQ